MKLAFEANLGFQLDAIKSVTDLFEGQPLASANDFQLQEIGKVNMQLNTINGIGNQLILSENQIFENLKTVQERNGIASAMLLEALDFAVEMETGTGKTYVYLRTIYELNKLYGFKKFVIVVPSVAIREGVLKTLEITNTHFQGLYENVSINFMVYNSSKVSTLRGFATSNNIEILVINVDSFAKDDNIINKPNDKLNGQTPITFLQATRPIVIVDEPQNMESEKRQKGISDLSPLCVFRYSATHKTKNNVTYSLNPIKAYELGLVKKIEVDSVLSEKDFNDAFICLESITAMKTKVTAKITILCNEKNEVKKKTITVKSDDNLYKLSGEREIYKEGYIINEIDLKNNFISFSNGKRLNKGATQGGMTDEIMKIQIRNTIQEHLDKEKKLNKLGIKVLSLFFIDRVANYRSYDLAGNAIKGKFALWFEEIYQEFISKDSYKELNRFSIEETHNGYFSQDKGKFKDTSGVTKADDDTYNLIMKDKEKLLNLDNSLRFIFSHSALREGWDNPNVFQICTLNESKSEIKKRQEIGRGLRLCVDSTGKRIYDQNINCLTVIANESYDDFAKALQQEMKDDFGVIFNNLTVNKADKQTIRYRKGFLADPYFLEIWEKLKTKTTYSVAYDTNRLIELAGQAVKEMPEVKTVSIRSTKTAIEMKQEGISSNYLGEKVVSFEGFSWKMPDILGYIQNKTELTRKTIYDILEKSGRLKDALLNPQLFLDLSSHAIKQTLNHLLIDGIKYQKIEGFEYEMALFESEDLNIYKNDFFSIVIDKSKTIYDNFIPLDSNVERNFAQNCETSEQVKFYFKLPNWFKIPTPIGNYNPDWAIVFENDKKVYFVVETKDTGTKEVDLSKLREEEQIKIKCGKAHFNEFEGLEYSVINRVGQLVN